MGLFERLSDEGRQARREWRAERREASRDEADRRYEEQRQFEEERMRREREEAERLRHMDMQDGRFDGRPY